MRQTPARHQANKDSRRKKSEAASERRWVGVAVAVLLAAIAVPRPGDLYDDASVRFLSAELAAGAVATPPPRIAVSPLELSRLPPAAFGD